MNNLFNCFEFAKIECIYDEEPYIPEVPVLAMKSSIKVADAYSCDLIKGRIDGNVFFVDDRDGQWLICISKPQFDSYLYNYHWLDDVLPSIIINCTDLKYRSYVDRFNTLSFSIDGEGYVVCKNERVCKLKNED